MCPSPCLSVLFPWVQPISTYSWDILRKFDTSTEGTLLKLGQIGALFDRVLFWELIMWTNVGWYWVFNGEPFATIVFSLVFICCIKNHYVIIRSLISDECKYKFAYRYSYRKRKIDSFVLKEKYWFSSVNLKNTTKYFHLIKNGNNFLLKPLEQILSNEIINEKILKIFTKTC